MIAWRIEWYSGGFETIEADDFEAASKRAVRLAKRRFLQISAVYQSSLGLPQNEPMKKAREG